MGSAYHTDRKLEKLATCHVLMHMRQLTRRDRKHSADEGFGELQNVLYNQEKDVSEASQQRKHAAYHYELD